MDRRIFRGIVYNELDRSLKVSGDRVINNKSVEVVVYLPPYKCSSKHLGDVDFVTINGDTIKIRGEVLVAVKKGEKELLVPKNLYYRIRNCVVRKIACLYDIFLK